MTNETSRQSIAMSRPEPLTFSIGINCLHPGEKLPPGDLRWGEYTRSFNQETLTIDSLITLVQEGFAFSPVMKNGHRSGVNFVSAQHIGLDFDTGDYRSSLDNLARPLHRRPCRVPLLDPQQHAAASQV
jgi:hypothetical protein